MARRRPLRRQDCIGATRARDAAVSPRVPGSLANKAATPAGAEPFTVGEVEVALRGVVERTGAKPGKVFQPVRVAIAGGTVSPGIFESVALLGREETLQRIDRTLERARAECNGAA